MFDLIEKAFLAGLGVVSLSRKKTEEFLAEMKEKYQLSEAEGQDFIEKARNMVNDSKSRISELVDAEVKKAMEKIGVVSRDDYETLLKRVEALEKQIWKE
jgi:polyhydroxyalkanoate synthesis regulator phasin